MPAGCSKPREHQLSRPGALAHLQARRAETSGTPRWRPCIGVSTQRIVPLGGVKMVVIPVLAEDADGRVLGSCAQYPSHVVAVADFCPERRVSARRRPPFLCLSSLLCIQTYMYMVASAGLDQLQQSEDRHGPVTSRARFLLPPISPPKARQCVASGPTVERVDSTADGRREKRIARVACPCTPAFLGTSLRPSPQRKVAPLPSLQLAT